MAGGREPRGRRLTMSCVARLTAAVAELASGQGGVVSRSQVLNAGGSDEWIESQLRARRWQRLYPGVHATFTGPLPWLSRAWAALLAAGHGAVLGGESALAAGGMRQQVVSDEICVCIPHDRHPDPLPGVIIRRRRHLERLCHPSSSLPRLRFDIAVLETASAQPGLGKAIGVIADACQQRLTTPARLQHALSLKPRLRWRHVLAAVIADVATGAHSYLEVQYLRRVERPHGLPTGTRQRRVAGGRTSSYRDVEYLQYGVITELDGRLGHESERGRAYDKDRDNRAAGACEVTLRFGYRQVMDAPCETAGLVADTLDRRGWRGAVRRCAPDCRIWDRMTGT